MVQKEAMIALEVFNMMRTFGYFRIPSWVRYTVFSVGALHVLKIPDDTRSPIMSTQLQSVLPGLDDVPVHILLCHHNVYSIYYEIYNVKFTSKICIIYEYSYTPTFLLQIYVLVLYGYRQLIFFPHLY